MHLWKSKASDSSQSQALAASSGVNGYLCTASQEHRNFHWGNDVIIKLTYLSSNRINIAEHSLLRLLPAEYAALLRQRAEHQTSDAEEQPALKQQVRLPVVVLQPNNEVQYGRAESCFFHQKDLKTPKDDSHGPGDSKLPNTPPKGAYYIQGQIPCFRMPSLAQHLANLINI